jgi:hypothetical protein
MASKKAKDIPESERSEPSVPTPHSGFRVKAMLRRSGAHAHAPSTLPPPPFETEAEVAGLEWWIQAHMALASDLLCLEQFLDAAPEARSTHAEAVRQLSGPCDAVRDALYELYCDAAHPRTADLEGFLPALKPHVYESYSWCAAVVGLLTQIAAQLRTEAGLDWDAAKAGYSALAEKLPRSLDGVRSGLAALPSIDFASPVEPLRNLPENLVHLAHSIAALDEALTKRFP